MPGNVSPPLSITHCLLSYGFCREKQPCACTISLCYNSRITHSAVWFTKLAIYRACQETWVLLSLSPTLHSPLWYIYMQWIFGEKSNLVRFAHAPFHFAICVSLHIVPHDSEDWLSLLATQFRRHFTRHVKSCLCTYISLVSFKMISMQRYTLIIICGIQQVLMQSAVSFSYISRAHYLMLEFWLLLSYHLTELVSV